MAPSLKSLPTELLEMIAYCCIAGVADNDDHTLLKLRATCSTIQAATRRCWVETYFTYRNVDLNASKLAQLKDVGKIPEFARAAKVFEVRCKDDSKQFNTGDSSSQLSAEAMDLSLSFLTALAFQNFKNLESIEFQPTKESASEQRTEQENLVIDFSNTFSFVLLAVQVCGVLPQHIYSPHGEQAYPTNFRIKTWKWMPQLSNCFLHLETFDICVELDRMSLAQPGLARDFATAINSMQSLTRLYLDFSYTTNEADKSGFFKELFENVCLLHLDEIYLMNVACYVGDLTHFLLKHASKLKCCRLWGISSYEAQATALFRTMLDRLRTSFDLEYLGIAGLDDLSDGARLSFPNIDQTMIFDREDEDGFLLVDVCEGIEFDGASEVREGLSNMFSCVVREAFW